MNLSEDNIIELLQSVARIEQKLDDHHKRLFGNGQPGLINELDDRVRKVERRWWWISGAIAMLGTAYEYVQHKLWGGHP